MSYNFVADSFYTKKLCSRLFKRSAILHGERPLDLYVFEPPLGGFFRRNVRRSS